MTLPRWMQPRDIVTIAGWIAITAAFVVTTRRDIAGLDSRVGRQAERIEQHERALVDNANWHAALTANADEDTRTKRDHDARIRALEERLAKIDVVANDVSWIKEHLKAERNTR